MSKAEETRAFILQKAFELIYRQGYQATSIDDIITKTQVTKGAFFYHFKNKEEMGLAMIREVMYHAMHPALVEPLLKSEDPVKDIYEMMKELLMANPFMQVKYGCPANNLIQEMAPLNIKFSHALSLLVEQWENALETTISNGKRSGKIKKEINGRQVASFIMSGYGGIRILGRLHSTKEPYTIYLKELKRYLKTLE